MTKSTTYFHETETNNEVINYKYCSFLLFITTAI